MPRTEGTVARSPEALTIAISGSGGTGDLQSDLRTFGALGVRGVCAVTAIAARIGPELLATHGVPAAVVRAQIQAALVRRPASVKVGLLATVPAIRAVARALAEYAGPIVVDPVLSEVDGLLRTRATTVQALVRSLLPLASLAAPTRDEAAFLSGAPIRDESELKAAARRIQAFGPRAVLVVGALLEGSRAVDVLLDGRTYVRLAPARSEEPAEARRDRLSAAITAHLALGETMPDAVEKALAFAGRGTF